MSILGYQEFETTILKDSKGEDVQVYLGEKICWVYLKKLSQTKKIVVRRLRKEHGKGPFILKKIERIPTERTLLHFIDKNNKKQRINEIYFRRYK